MQLKKIFLVIAVLLALVFTQVIGSYAYDQPWDQGHRTTQIGDPDNTDPANGNNKSQGGEPVHLYSGNFAYAHIDFQVPGQGLNIILQRTYNSQDLYNGPFGIGWNFSYNIKVVTASFIGSSDAEQGTRNSTTAKTITARFGEATRLEFKVQPGGTVENPKEFQGKMLLKADGRVRLDQKTGISYEFNALGAVSKISDRNGNRIQLDYDHQGRLVTIKDTGDRTYTFTYNSSGKIAAITDPAGRVYAYRYDDQGRLIEYEEPNGASTKYAYNTDHLLTEITDAEGVTFLKNNYDNQKRVASQYYNGGTYKFYYGSLNSSGDRSVTLRNRKNNDTKYYLAASGRPLQITDSYGNRTTYQYNEAGNLLQVTDPKNRVTKFTYDQLQNCTSITDAQDQVESMTYNNLNQLSSFTDKKGQKTEFFYDEKGNSTQVKNAQGNSKYYTFNAQGQALQYKDYQGNITKFTYDNYGNLASVTNPLEKQTHYKYDILGRLIEKADANGGKTTYVYDYNKVKKLTDALGNAYTFKYNLKEKLTEASDPLGNTSKYEYDNWGHLTAMVDPVGNKLSYTYDLEDRITKIANPNGYTTSYEYDRLNRLARIINSQNKATKYTYDQVGNITQVTDVKGHQTIYTYDELGRLLQETDPAGRVWQYTYTPLDKISTVTKPNGDLNQFAYDTLNRLTQITYADNGTKTYTYDNLDRVLEVAEGSQKLTYQYDSLGRLIKVTDVFNRSLNYGYDNVGNCTSLTLPDQRSFKYSYDLLSNLTQLVTPNNEEFNFAYDVLGRRTKLTYPNTKVIQYSYDTLGRLIGLANGVENYTYTYDKAFNITAIASSQGTTSYNYDSLNRLLEVGLPNNSRESYTYDEMGNRLSKTTPQGTVNYTYNNINQLLTAGNWQYQYGLNGNLTEKSNGTDKFDYQYDKNERLTVLSKNSINLATYSYDPTGRRVSSQVNGTTTQHLWDGFSLLGEYQANSLNSLYTVGTGIDEILAVYQNNSYYFHPNHLSSPVAVTDSSGGVVLNQRYNTFGKITASTGSFNTQLGFIGREQSSTTGLVYIRARYYDPEVGRFLTEDPARDGMNWYSYANSNPVSYVDRDGLVFDTVADIMFIGWDLYDIYQNPCDPMAWAALGADVGGLLLPFVTGGGRALKVASRADDLIDASKAIDKADDAFDAARHGLCFTAETLVKTKDGEKPIAEIKTGDLVYSQNTETREIGLKSVVNTFVKETSSLIKLVIGNTEIKTTADHPFWVEGKDWVAAANLKAGDKLQLYSEKEATVTKVEVIKLAKAIKVYNFEVADWHTYYVSAHGVLVHNSCKADDIIEGAGKGVEIKNPVLDNSRTGSALKTDAQHAFNDIVDNYVGQAKKFNLKGGDGINRDLYQIKGSLNGKQGVFEWIVDPKKGVTHRRFIEGVGITGKPNARR